MQPENTPLRNNLKLALLAGTCLTTSASVARAAVTVNESSDFANTVAEALLAPLPVGTTNVTGNVFSVTDPNDFVAFINLLAGSSFTMSFTGVYNNFDVLDSLSGHVGSPAAVFGATSATFTGTVPADGKLVAQVAYNEGSPYTIDLAATLVPEPSAAALAGLGLAAATFRRNRRSKKSQ